MLTANLVFLLDGNGSGLYVGAYKGLNKQLIAYIRDIMCEGAEEILGDYMDPTLRGIYKVELSYEIDIEGYVNIIDVFYKRHPMMREGYAYTAVARNGWVSDTHTTDEDVLASAPSRRGVYERPLKMFNRVKF